MIETFQLTPESTELHPDELAALIPSIATKRELNEFERLNILEADAWAFSKRRLTTTAPWTDSYVRELHRKMLGSVWKWAGEYRRTEKSLGVLPHQIREMLFTRLGDVKYWTENATFPPDEIAIRLHHRLVQIHPFPNGNGRHARMMADVIVVKLGAKRFTWGQENLAADGPMRQKYISALKLADSDPNNTEALLRFARS